MGVRPWLPLVSRMLLDASLLVYHLRSRYLLFYPGDSSTVDVVVAFVCDSS